MDRVRIDVRNRFRFEVFGRVRVKGTHTLHGWVTMVLVEVRISVKVKCYGLG